MQSNQKRENTPTEQNKEDNILVLYRLKLVEEAVKEVGKKMDTADNIKRSDLIEFREAILARFGEVRDDLQRQIDEKADASTVKALNNLVKAIGASFATVITGCIIYYLTYGVHQ